MSKFPMTPRLTTEEPVIYDDFFLDISDLCDFLKFDSENKEFIIDSLNKILRLTDETKSIECFFKQTPNNFYSYISSFLSNDYHPILEQYEVFREINETSAYIDLNFLVSILSKQYTEPDLFFRYEKLLFVIYTKLLCYHKLNEYFSLRDIATLLKEIKNIFNENNFKTSSDLEHKTSYAIIENLQEKIKSVYPFISKTLLSIIFNRKDIFFSILETDDLEKYINSKQEHDEDTSITDDTSPEQIDRHHVDTRALEEEKEDTYITDDTSPQETDRHQVGTRSLEEEKEDTYITDDTSPQETDRHQVGTRSLEEEKHDTSITDDTSPQETDRHHIDTHALEEKKEDTYITDDTSPQGTDRYHIDTHALEEKKEDTYITDDTSPQGTDRYHLDTRALEEEKEDTSLSQLNKSRAYYHINKLPQINTKVGIVSKLGTIEEFSIETEIETQIETFEELTERNSFLKFFQRIFSCCFKKRDAVEKQTIDFVSEKPKLSKNTNKKVNKVFPITDEIQSEIIHREEKESFSDRDTSSATISSKSTVLALRTREEIFQRRDIIPSDIAIPHTRSRTEEDILTPHLVGISSKSSSSSASSSSSLGDSTPTNKFTYHKPHSHTEESIECTGEIE